MSKASKSFEKNLEIEWDTANPNKILITCEKISTSSFQKKLEIALVKWEKYLENSQNNLVDV